MIGQFWLLLFWPNAMPSKVDILYCGTDQLLCCLIMDIPASGILTQLSILMVLGWSLRRMASLIPWAYLYVVHLYVLMGCLHKQQLKLKVQLLTSLSRSCLEAWIRNWHVREQSLHDAHRNAHWHDIHNSGRYKCPFLFYDRYDVIYLGIFVNLSFQRVILGSHSKSCKIEIYLLLWQEQLLSHWKECAQGWRLNSLSNF